jgi:hypothetical protein
MDPFQRILDLATREGAPSKLPGRRRVLRVSVYADDVAIFIKPNQQDATMVKHILNMFVDVTGLATNFTKSSSLPV